MSADNVIPLRAGPHAGEGHGPAFNDERPAYHIALPGFPDITAADFKYEGADCHLEYSG